MEAPPSRRQAGAAVIALGIGWLLGPGGLGFLRPALMEDGGLVESVGEMALLVCLFCIGLRLRMPLALSCWRTPLRLSTLSFLVTAVLAAAAGHLVLNMSLTHALLLGFIVAPTEAVFASDGHFPTEADDDAAVTLAAESGINNGLAPAAVGWVLGMIGLLGTDSQAIGSLSLLVAWAVLGGVLLGWLIGAGMARAITLLDPERQADFLEETVVFSTAALAYGAALALRADGFMAVFIAGIALSHGGRLRHPLRNRPLMPRVARVAAVLERVTWLGVIVLVGALLGNVEFHARMLVFALLLLLLLRPLAVRLGLGQVAMSAAQWRTVAWCCSRGVAPVYCLAFALNHGLSAPFARELTGATLVVVVTSVIASAIAALPLSRPSPGTVDL
ncbi:MAG TPA: hypothetical protein VJQ47_02845 [Steroidobacteraceae bacterium]|nr:hypothetical protein [Steroidobacteraceae bacterium]